MRRSAVWRLLSFGLGLILLIWVLGGVPVMWAIGGDSTDPSESGRLGAIWVWGAVFLVVALWGALRRLDRLDP
jgi:hypothetical protein